MAGNKFDSAFKVWEFRNIELTYNGLYNQEIKFSGTPEQVIRHLMTQIK